MTIREYLTKRVWLLRAVRFGWAVVPLSLIFLFPQSARPHVLYLIGPAYIAMLAVSLWIMRQTRCPLCQGSLSEFTKKPMPARFGFSDSCPHCGVSFDEPM